MRSRAACMRSAVASTVLAAIQAAPDGIHCLQDEINATAPRIDPIVRCMNATELRDRRIGGGHDQPPLLNGDERARASTKAALLQPATGHAEMRDRHSARG